MTLSTTRGTLETFLATNTSRLCLIGAGMLPDGRSFALEKKVNRILNQSSNSRRPPTRALQRDKKERKKQRQKKKERNKTRVRVRQKRRVHLDGDLTPKIVVVHQVRAP